MCSVAYIRSANEDSIKWLPIIWAAAQYALSERWPAHMEYFGRVACKDF